MTDDPRTPDDDLLRDALHAEADDVHADDALLARIRSATAPPSAWRRRTPLLAMAAAVVVVVGLAAILLTRDDGESVVLEEPSVTEPAGSGGTTTTIELTHHDEIVALFGCDGTSSAVVVVLVGGPEGSFAAVQDALLATPGRNGQELLKPKAVAERLTAAGTPADEQDVPGAAVGWFASADEALEARATLADLPGVLAVSTTDCTGSAPTGEGRPTLVALVREDGWLVTVDLETGEQRELHTEGDPRQAEPGLEEGGPYFIDAVDLSPDGQWIYFSTCCEPADGMTFRIPTEGGAVEEVGFGAYPRVSPDGRYVATAGSAYLYVRPTDDVGFDVQPALLEIGCCAKHLAWSPDGAELAFVFGTGADGETPQVRRFRWDGTALAESDMGKPDNPGRFALWMPDNTLNVSDGDPIADDRGRAQDASYEWILWVDEEGVVKEQAGFESGDITPIAGLPRALAADW
jgi:hypothetical protein